MLIFPLLSDNRNLETFDRPWIFCCLVFNCSLFKCSFLTFQTSRCPFVKKRSRADPNCLFSVSSRCLPWKDLFSHNYRSVCLHLILIFSPKSYPSRDNWTISTFITCFFFYWLNDFTDR